MKSTIINGKSVSKISLGTVQLGLNYGIANNLGQPSEAQSFEMLATALDNGITGIDTARAYGESEKVLGHFFKTRRDLPFITTKVPRFDADSDAELEKKIIESVETSLETLGVPKVDNIMLHNAYNLTVRGDATARVMGSLIGRGYCDMVGASVYTADDVHEIFKHEEYTATQIPMSVFDQRLISGGIVEELRQRNFTVFVRSVFLQGLFFLDPETITDPILLQYAKPGILKLRDAAEKEGMSVEELAVSFLRDLPGVTGLVLGADTAKQVLDDIKCAEVHDISEETMEMLKREFADTNIPEIMKVLSRPKQ